MKLNKLFLLLLLIVSMSASGQDNKYPERAPMTPAMSEYWTPQPAVVTPGNTCQSLVTPPSDAIVLFDGEDLSQWENSKGGSVEWTIADGVFTVKGGTGEIRTKQLFDDFQLHIEWRMPENIKGESQGRGNSGVFLQGMYEIQILDCYQNETYVNGQTGSIYKQTPPLVNAMQKPGMWNTYDIIYTAPTFTKDGNYRTPPTVTVLQNGVLLQNHTTILGTTEYIGFPNVKEHGAGPIILQDHGDPVSFRNIWIREL